MLAIKKRNIEVDDFYFFISIVTVNATSQKSPIFNGQKCFYKELKKVFQVVIITQKV